MGLSYLNLDAATRAEMANEIQADITAGRLYLSPNLNEQGRLDYPTLLMSAVTQGTDDSLAADIQSRLNTHEAPRKLKNGNYTAPPVMRSNAHTMLAEGEFNRFYARAICIRALANGKKTVKVYRAKAVSSPRPESQNAIGTDVDAQTLLADLRAHVGVDTALKLPPGPNSGLSVAL